MMHFLTEAKEWHLWGIQRTKTGGLALLLLLVLFYDEWFVERTSVVCRLDSDLAECLR